MRKRIFAAVMALCVMCGFFVAASAQSVDTAFGNESVHGIYRAETGNKNLMFPLFRRGKSPVVSDPLCVPRPTLRSSTAR